MTASIIRRGAPTALVWRATETPEERIPPMPLNALHHITVQTDDLEATRDFYRDVLGLEVGFRPDLDFPGYWLYCGDVPVVHLVPRGNAIGGGPSRDTGPFDHFAFLASDFPGCQGDARQEGHQISRKSHPQAADRSAVLPGQQQRDGRAELPASLTKIPARLAGTSPAMTQTVGIKGDRRARPTDPGFARSEYRLLCRASTVPLEWWSFID